MSSNNSNGLKRVAETNGADVSDPKKPKLDPDAQLDDIFSEPDFLTPSQELNTNVNEDFSDLPGKILESNVLSEGNKVDVQQPQSQPQSQSQAQPQVQPQAQAQSQSQPVQPPISTIPQSQSLTQIPLETGGAQVPLTGQTLGQQQAQQKVSNDPSRLNDAIVAAGVDIQQEEELLLQQQYRRDDVSKDLKQIIRSSKPPPFLNGYHLASFVTKVARENGVQQYFLQEAELLELVSAACETWLSNIIHKTIILARHRRRGIPALNPKNKKPGSGSGSSNSSSSSVVRSELSKELRNLALRQKDLEERRVQKRIALGLEKNDIDGNGDGSDSKAGVEETLHRAANATAAMMSNTGRKKYSWMTSANGGATDASKGSDEKGKKSSIISIRGENGLRYREIRTGNSVTMKDLLGAIEGERMGTDKAIVKAYAKLKD
ncbi:transcription initiation factor TFIID subunit 4 [Scheffersomyces amazonensis]|uniref:transcription initiation factor TFIID subunit 4 n=1 Tax=Scheffersomyces amazonensis TaxID=1078765 RepID=UPI00315E008C